MPSIISENCIRALLEMSRNLLDGVPFSNLYSDELIPNPNTIVFWKDKFSNYLGCSKKFAEGTGFSTPQLVIGKNDYDLAWDKNETECYRRDDNLVIPASMPKFNIEETQRQANGHVIYYLTSKFPVYSTDRKLSGLIGISTDITEHKALEKRIIEINANFIANKDYPQDITGLELIQSIDRLKKISDYIQKEKVIYVFMHNERKIVVSSRQLLCITLLLQGKSSKQIAHELNISPRTVESHLNTIKIKFRCRTKSELIYTVLSGKGYIDCIH